VIVKDDRDDAENGICENCEKEKDVRPVEAFGWLGESRGFHLICYDCFGARITWRPTGKHKRLMVSPVRI